MAMKKRTTKKAMGKRAKASEPKKLSPMQAAVKVLGQARKR
jgi:hypothetical protein